MYSGEGSSEIRKCFFNGMIKKMYCPFDFFKLKENVLEYQHYLIMKSCYYVRFVIINMLNNLCRKYGDNIPNEVRAYSCTIIF